MDAYINKITSPALSVKVPFLNANLKQQTLTPPNRPSLLSVPDMNYSSEVDNIKAPLSDGKLGKLTAPFVTFILLVLVCSPTPLFIEYFVDPPATNNNYVENIRSDKNIVINCLKFTWNKHLRMKKRNMK